jgi:hypothetical protein
MNDKNKTQKAVAALVVPDQKKRKTSAQGPQLAVLPPHP